MGFGMDPPVRWSAGEAQSHSQDSSYSCCTGVQGRPLEGALWYLPGSSQPLGLNSGFEGSQMAAPHPGWVGGSGLILSNILPVWTEFLFLTLRMGTQISWIAWDLSPALLVTGLKTLYTEQAAIPELGSRSPEEPRSPTELQALGETETGT